MHMHQSVKACQTIFIAQHVQYIKFITTYQIIQMLYEVYIQNIQSCFMYENKHI